MEISNENVATDDLNITLSKKLDLVRAGARDFFNGIEKRMSKDLGFKEYILSRCENFSKNLFMEELNTFLAQLEQTHTVENKTKSFVDMVKDKSNVETFCSIL
jgi:hypothetical protein